MIYSVRTTAVLDTNVIYPIVSRDLLFWFPHYDLYIPKWNKDVFSEWQSLMERKGVALEDALKRIDIANRAFPDALVNDYEDLIMSLNLPDEKDRHVLAAAIKSKADFIVTNNLKDFPADYLQSFGLKAKNADDFMTDIIDLNNQRSLEAFREMVFHKRNPMLLTDDQ